MTDKQETGKCLQYTRKKIEVYSYGLAEQIGKGYSSRVYRGRHDQTEENVAVKVIDLKLLKNDINKQLLLSQIEILKELKDCSHVLHLCDIFSTRNNTYIITELCSSDLSKVIKQGLPHAQAAPYMQHILKGYLQLHARRIIHRDLKPANILLTHESHIRIADFGFAIKAEALAKSSKYNVGSPLYMAPESLRKNEYSYKSDIWALGVIFYEMLFTDTPWRAKSEKELLRKIQNQPIESIIANKNLPPAEKDFLVRCLRVDKHARMSPEELETFKFGFNSSIISAPSNVLAERSMNRTQRIDASPLIENKNAKADISPQDIRRRDKAFDQNDQNITSPHFKVHEQKRNTQVHKGHTEGHIKLKSQEAEVVRVEPLGKQQKKLISKILISEVHFCRFLFKLLQKIRESGKVGLLREGRNEVELVCNNYAAIISNKIRQLSSFKEHNFIGCEGYREYKWTSDCDKLMNIVEEYRERYQTDLQQCWNQQVHPTSSVDSTNRLIIVLFQLLERTVGNMQVAEEEISGVSRQVVILDYLVTAQQLLEMVGSTPDTYQRFARKSRIEEIVEGRTVDIHFELYQQIMLRVKQVMQKKHHFISFGTDAPLA